MLNYHYLLLFIVTYLFHDDGDETKAKNYDINAWFN